MGKGERGGLHTGSVFAPTDLDKLLDIADFARHDGRWGVLDRRERESFVGVR